MDEAPRGEDSLVLRPRVRWSGQCASPSPAKSFHLDVEKRLAQVEIAGVRRNVNVGLLAGEEGEAGPGDWVLVHVGFALSRVDEAEAAATLELLRGMGAEFGTEIES